MVLCFAIFIDSPLASPRLTAHSGARRLRATSHLHRLFEDVLGRYLQLPQEDALNILKNVPRSL